MDGMYNICIGIIVTLLVLFLVVKYFDKKYARELKSKPLAEIEKMVFRYETEYFKFIGEDHASVQEFRQAVENKDISVLIKNWITFRSNFQELERKAGHNDRPLIMDYYYTYELELKELQRRTKK